MSKKHMALYILIGWALAAVFPPQALLARVKK